jgi:mono/diheme cytochrome c family protein
MSPQSFPLWKVAFLAGAVFGAVTSIASTDAPAQAEQWIAPGRAARKQNPVVADANSVAEGKALFVQACLPCHGPAGKGDGPAAPTLQRNGVSIRPGNLSNPALWQQSDGTLFWKISEGRTPMPAFQEAFTEEQRWKIINYVRTLAPKPKDEPSKTGGTP